MVSILSDVLDVCLGYMTLPDFHGLCATSKVLRGECLRQPDKVVAKLLHRAIEDGRVPKVPATGLHVSADFSEYLQPCPGPAYEHIAWLLEVFSKRHGIMCMSACLDLQDALLRASGDPVMSTLLIAYGARVSYALIRRRAAVSTGPITWLRAGNFLGLSVASDIPSSTITLCLGQQLAQEQLHELSVDDMFALISIAFTNPHPPSRSDPVWLLEQCKTQAREWSADQVQQLLQLGLTSQYFVSQASSQHLSSHLQLLLEHLAVKTMPLKDAKLQILQTAACQGQAFGEIYGALVQQPLEKDAVAAIFRSALMGNGPEDAFGIVYGPGSPLGNHDAHSDIGVLNELMLAALSRQNLNALKALFVHARSLSPSIPLSAMILASCFGTKCILSLAYEELHDTLSTSPPCLPPAIALLCGDSLFRLLEVLLHLPSGNIVQQLVKVPAAQQLSEQMVESLLQQAAAQSTPAIMEQLAGLPHAIRSLQARAAKLLEGAISAANSSTSQWLQHKLAAQVVPWETVGKLLGTAVKAGQLPNVHWLVEQPTAALSSDMVQKLLETALHSSSSSSHEAASSSSSTISSSSSQAARSSTTSRSQAASRSGSSTWCTVQALLLLPAVSSISVTNVVKLLGLAVGAGEASIVALLGDLKAGRRVAGDALGDLLQQAVEVRALSSLKVLLPFPAAAALPEMHALKLFHTTVQDENPEAVALLLKLPAAKQFTSEDVGSLLELALQQGAAGTGRGFDRLVQLAAAKSLGPECVVKLLRLALQTRGRELDIKWLLCHTAMAARSQEDKLRLLQVAASAGHCLQMLLWGLVDNHLGEQEVGDVFEATLQAKSGNSESCCIRQPEHPHGEGSHADDSKA